MFRALAALVLVSTAAHARGRHFTIFEPRDAGMTEHSAFQVISDQCRAPDAEKRTGCLVSASGMHVFVFEGRVIRGVKDGRVRWEVPAPGALVFHTIGLMVFDAPAARHAIWIEVETGAVTRRLTVTKSRAIAPTPTWCGDRVLGSYTSSLAGVTAAECLVLD